MREEYERPLVCTSNYPVRIHLSVLLVLLLVLRAVPPRLVVSIGMDDLLHKSVFGLLHLTARNRNQNRDRLHQHLQIIVKG